MVKERLESDRSSGWLGEEKLMIGIGRLGSGSTGRRRRRKEKVKKGTTERGHSPQGTNGELNKGHKVVLVCC